MDKSKENTLTYIHVYINTHLRTHKPIYIQKVFNLILVRQADPFRDRPIKAIAFYFCICSTVWEEFINFFQIIRASVIDGIVGYSICTLVNPFAGR